MKQDIQQFSLRKCTCIDIECHYFDEIFIIGCTGSCQNDNFQCRHWRKFLQNVNISISVWTLGISKSIWTYRASFCWGVWQQTMGEWWNSPQTNKSPRETIVYLERPQAAKQGKHGQNCTKNTVEVIRNGRVCFFLWYSQLQCVTHNAGTGKKKSFWEWAQRAWCTCRDACQVR